MSNTSNTLQRTLGFRDLVLLVVGGVIGSGIFLVPGGVLQKSGGSIGLALVVWLIGGVLSLLGALSYGELGGMIPEAGGVYVYIREAFGPVFAFLYGWGLLLAIASGSVATLAVAASSYLQQFIPVGAVGGKLLAIGLIAILAAVNVRGTALSVRFVSIATVLKVGALAFLIIALPIVGHGFSAVHAWWPEHWNGAVLSGAGVAMISVLWAYEGWQYATTVAGEVVNPQRNFPGGLAVGTLAIVVIYVMANIGYIAALGPEGVANSNRIAADAVQATFSPGLATLIAIPIVISMLSAAQSLMLTSARVYYAMAKDRVFFQALAEVHPKFGTPAYSIIVGSVVAAVLTLIGNFQALLGYVIFVGWIFYGLAGLSVIVLRRTRPDAPRPFKVPGYPVTPALFVLAAAALVVNTIATQDPVKTLGALGAVATGIPIYYVWKRNRPAE